MCLAEPSLSGRAPEAGVAWEPRGLAVLVNPECFNSDTRGGGGAGRRGGRGSQVSVSSIRQLLQGCAAGAGDAPKGQIANSSVQAGNTHMGYLL